MGGLISARKTSVKRCLSPCDEPGPAMTGGVKRKSTDPALLQLQSEVTSLSELDSQYRLVVAGARRHSETTQSYEPSTSTLSSSHCDPLTTTRHSSSYTSWTKPVQVTESQSDSDQLRPSTVCRAGETRTAAAPTVPSWTSSLSRRDLRHLQSLPPSPASV